MIEKALAGELDDEARQMLELAQAAMMLASDDAAKRLDAAEKLGEARKAIVRPLLHAAHGRPSTMPAVKAALKASLAGLDRSLAISSALAEAFTGVSLGSILLLAALGLAITYGLMGVINMAHGELIMIGAYATWLVQSFFSDVVAGPVRLVPAGRGAGGLPGFGAGGRGDGAHGDPLSVWPPAGNAAGHLGHQPGADAGCAQRSSARRTWAWRTRAG